MGQALSKVEIPSLTPVQERPCVVAPAAKRCEDHYAKWKKFDADAALLELDNEETTEDSIKEDDRNYDKRCNTKCFYQQVLEDIHSISFCM